MVKMKGKNYTQAEEKFIRENYSQMSCQEIASELKRPKLSVYAFANRMGIEKRTGFGRFWNKTEWTEEMIAFLKSNFHKMTNAELASALNLKITIVRLKCASLGLRRFDPAYWNEEQVQFLKNNYRFLGDVEIAEKMQLLFPKNKPWTKSHISKKRRYLQLNRTSKEVQSIISKNCAPGGRQYTIDKNSSSKNMHDSWVAMLIAWRNPALRKEILKNRELLEIKRTQIILSREIKKLKSA